MYLNLRSLTFSLLFIPFFKVQALLCFDQLAYAYRINRPNIDDIQVSRAIEIAHPAQHLLGEPRIVIFREFLLNADFNQIRREIEKRPIPYVLGPDGKRHIVDRHHTLYTFHLVLPELVAKGLPVHRLKFEMRMVEDFSHLSPKEFSQQMMAKKYLYPLNNNWTEDLTSIPSHVALLEFNYYRGLAWIVRKSGAIKKAKLDKESVPFLEFMWANVFRQELQFKHEQFTRKKIRKAIALALAENGSHTDLPGYLPPLLGKGDSLPSVDDCMLKIDEMLQALERSGLLVE